MTEPIEQRLYHRLETAADLVHMPPARVRRYVRIGLIRPSVVEGERVLFGEPELRRLRRIRRLNEDLGLSAAAIEVVMRLLDEMAELRRALREQQGGRPPGGA
jgi:DNA-binding transcriptional MerR regulator